jgi:hypothetical protein
VSRTSAVSTGINILCNAFISMSMVHFVFEMQTVRVNGDNAKMHHFRVIKIILIAILTVHVVIYDITRVVQESEHDIGLTG